jgi:outer membrane PBP1 activator LpoA protein
MIDPLYIDRSANVSAQDAQATAQQQLKENTGQQKKKSRSERYHEKTLARSRENLANVEAICDRIKPDKNRTYSWTKLNEYQLCELVSLPEETIRFLTDIGILTEVDYAAVIDGQQCLKNF